MPFMTLTLLAEVVSTGAEYETGVVDCQMACGVCGPGSSLRFEKDELSKMFCQAGREVEVGVGEEEEGNPPVGEERVWVRWRKLSR